MKNLLKKRTLNHGNHGGNYTLLSLLILALFAVSAACSNGNKNSEAEAVKEEPADFVEDTLGLNLSMVYVEGGEFMMGGTREQGTEAKPDERPLRKVKLDSYYIGKFEITKDQWSKIMGEEPPAKESKDYPAESIVWSDAKEFCNKLSKITGRKYCLPTEAQWEYAARGGVKNDGTKYSGSNALDSVANCKNYVDERLLKGGTKKPNGLGIYDMSGNIWEWCADVYDEYNTETLENPKVTKGKGNREEYVMRGGSWCSFEEQCRVSSRSSHMDLSTFYDFGFRVVMIP